jgi:micrococcal nuclease
MEEQLKNATNNIPLFSLKGKKFSCKVVNVYDGDTCKIVIKLFDEFTKFNLRLEGYDSPEKRISKLNPNRDELKNKAEIARQALINIIGDEILIVKCGKWDKYGRLLGTLFKEDLNINNYMIENGYGYEYDGGTKRKY